MKFSPQLVHYVQAILASVSAGALAWAQVDPAHAGLAHSISGAALSAATVLGILSGSALVAKPPSNPATDLH